MDELQRKLNAEWNKQNKKTKQQKEKESAEKKAFIEALERLKKAQKNYTKTEHKRTGTKVQKINKKSHVSSRTKAFRRWKDMDKGESSEVRVFHISELEK